MWTLGAFGLSTVLRLVSNVILARLLFPEAFGLMALVTVVIQGINMFSDTGIQSSIIQNSRGDKPYFLNTAWTIQVVRGILLTVIVASLAIPFAQIYNEPQLLALIPIAGFSALISGFNSTSLYTERRHLRVKSIALIDLSSQIVSSILTIGIALAYPSVWALVAGALAAHSVRLILSHLAIGKLRNRFYFNRQAFTELFQFGKWIFLSTLLTFLVGQGDRLIFGKLTTLDNLGVYAIASIFAILPVTVLGRLSQTVIFPAYCRMIEQNADFPRYFINIRTPFVVSGLILVSLVFVMAPLIVELLYDKRYVDAGWMIQLLMLGAMFKVLEETNGMALLAHGNARLVAYGGLGKLLAMGPLIALGFIFEGFAGAVLGFALSESIRYLVSVNALHKYSLSTGKMDLVLMFLWASLTGIGFCLASQLDALHPVAELIIGTGFVSLLWACAVWGLILRGYVPRPSVIKDMLFRN